MSWRWPLLVGAGAALAALAAVVVYATHGLTLSHYDGRAHLVVARRIVDSLTPGWHQIGAVWLPLPHLINLVPVQWDWAYRTGGSAIALSVICMGVSAFASARLLLRATGSYLAGAITAALLVTNANVLYLHATPMTEPLLYALAFLGVERLDAWLRDPSRPAASAGIWIFLLCLTRYEGWMLTAAAMGLALVALVDRRDRVWGLRRWASLAAWPAAAVIGFLFLSRATVGEWFVSSGFFVPDNPARGDVGLVLEQLRDGVERLSSPAYAAFGAFGLVAVAARGLSSARHRSVLVVLALAAMAALPFLAFHAGHPFRIRYMTPLVASAALYAGFVVGFAPSLARVAIIGAGALLIVPDLRPYDHTAPMIVEARREERHQRAREAVTQALEARWDGSPILMSMGSLAHYMHDLGRRGFDIGDFIHEGTGEIWNAAVADPAAHTRFMLVEERAEGGDLFAHLLRDRPDIAGQFTRVASGGNVAMYERLEGW